MIDLNIKITGESIGDLVLAVNEVLSLVEEGYLNGKNSNDSGGFSFYISGNGTTEEIDEEE